MTGYGLTYCRATRLPGETFEFTHPGENGLRTPKTALCDINPLRGKWLQNAKISGSRLQNLLQILSASNLLFHFPFYLTIFIFALFCPVAAFKCLAWHCDCGARPVPAQSTTTVQVGLSGHAPKASEDWTEAFGAWPERPTCTVASF